MNIRSASGTTSSIPCSRLSTPVKLSDFDEARTEEFTAKFDVEPIEAFGPFLGEIAKLGSA
jgi:hypothetical protein